MKKTPKMWYKIPMVTKNKEYSRNSRFLGCFCVIILLALSGCTNVFMENLLARKEGPYKGPYGDGSPGNPFRVYDVETLKRVGNGTGVYSDWDLTVYYRQERDIDMSGETSWMPIGSSGTPFVGTYDGKDSKGKNRVIKNLAFDNSADDFQGLFGYIDGTVKNLGLVKCTIQGKNNVGGVAGYTDSNATVENCYVTGHISGNDNIGGVVGINFGIVQNCYTSVDVYGNNNIGGVVGDNTTTVQNCYATGNISGDTAVGGIVGTTSVRVEYCYAKGNVGIFNISNNVGGIAGSASGTLKYCVALNLNINVKPSFYYGRVIGSGGSGSTDNFGRAGMTLNDVFPTSPPWIPNMNGNDGGDVVPSGGTNNNYEDPQWWKDWVNLDFNTVWKWDSGRKLPVLRNVGPQ